ncbi:MAG: phosphatase [Actinomycetota bacterium]|nr:phosphatase [Actinomycetota bacterium]
MLVGSIALPDGTRVRGRGRSQPLPEGPLPDFGLYLGREPRGSRDWRPDWPAEWVAWRDFGTPRGSASAAAAIRRAYDVARSGVGLEIACDGGTGRTGTVIACMAILAGHPASDALDWTRANYRPRAVETRANDAGSPGSPRMTQLPTSSRDSSKSRVPPAAAIRFDMSTGGLLLNPC